MISPAVLVAVLTLSQSPPAVPRAVTLGPSPLKGAAFALEVRVSGFPPWVVGTKKNGPSDDEATRELTTRVQTHFDAAHISSSPPEYALTRNGGTRNWKPAFSLRCEVDKSGGFTCLARALVLVELKDGSGALVDAFVKQAVITGTNKKVDSSVLMGTMRNVVDEILEDFKAQVKKANDGG